PTLNFQVSSCFCIASFSLAFGAGGFTSASKKTLRCFSDDSQLLYFSIIASAFSEAALNSSNWLRLSVANRLLSSFVSLAIDTTLSDPYSLFEKSIKPALIAFLVRREAFLFYVVDVFSDGAGHHCVQIDVAAKKAG